MEVVEVMEVVVVVVVLLVMAEDRGFHSRERRRGDGFGRELSPRVVVVAAVVVAVVVVVVLVVAFVGGLVGAQLARPTADLLPVRLRRAGVVRQGVDVQADTWEEETTEKTINTTYGYSKGEYMKLNLKNSTHISS